ncbi:MAG: aminopeptidase P family protein [Anaerolineae bacterium]|nr:aminopeptidase P family protein [Anaerolineae bacterium]
MVQTIDPWTFIPKEEFVTRQNNLRKAAQAAGLDGVVVYSRGGAPIDMCADVLYLTSHYPQQPYVAEHTGVGSARSHGVVILPVEGETILIVDIPYWRRDVVVADDVRASIWVTQRVGEALKDAGLYGKRIGLCGTSYMTASAFLGFQSVIGDTEVVIVDEMVEKLRMIKSPREQDLIRIVADIGNRSIEAMLDAAVVGATEADCVTAALNVLVPEGATLYDAACASGEHADGYTWARVPSHDANRPMEKGDIFHVDCYGAFGGYLWDFGRLRFVGDEPTDLQRILQETTIEYIEYVCGAIKPGMTGDDVIKIGQAWLAESPVVQAIPKEKAETEGFPAVGHGVGMSWEAPWLMVGEQTVIEPGMYLAVETMLGSSQTGLTFFEHNGLMHEDGLEILTTCRKRWW